MTIRGITSSAPTFAITSNCGAMLPAMSICTISVQANGPSVYYNLLYTSFSGVLTVANDAAAGGQTAAAFFQSYFKATNSINFGSHAICSTRTSTLNFYPERNYTRITSNE